MKEVNKSKLAAIEISGVERVFYLFTYFLKRTNIRAYTEK